ncbi:sodium:proton exchanger [Candidatus Berkelbacteria bacterium CG10_big_fil_rev_8_21_14_0_10_43_13]|uniref:Sodium:proton exchanger n=1 Tax=Candidatus Berkelbacteria bacterium CG10_big_fil_rev_8_21_14_0_10_43_13 TaxID=1974514 RepID=A0A2H0W5E5_9BACT|nr:MAG: sodium:proton exchanger [Candidatus Berkelbacteria bacterium CG10_big_fil_rev_8_21_14_0_10_43_13]
MLPYIILIVGIFFLVKGADYLVEGSSLLAEKFGISKLVVGLTIVAFGTSMPELVVNVVSAIKGTSDVAFGNILGSNMANTLLILGIAAMIRSLKVKKSTTLREIPYSFFAVLVLYVFATLPNLAHPETHYLYRFEGAIMLVLFGFFLFHVFRLARDGRVNFKEISLSKDQRPNIVIILTILVGLVGLYLGGTWTVDGAISIARSFGLSEFLISATVIAVGTSLPELITSVVAVRKGNVDLGVGNIVGSNIFNILWVLGLTSVIRPIAFPATVIIDLAILLIVTFLLFAFIFFGKKHILERWQGFVCVLLYVAYLIFLIIRG